MPKIKTTSRRARDQRGRPSGRKRPMRGEANDPGGVWATRVRLTHGTWSHTSTQPSGCLKHGAKAGRRQGGGRGGRHGKNGGGRKG